jgi:hypothetical protein
MKKRVYQNKWDREVVFCKGTDIPPISMIEFMMFERIREALNENRSTALTMDEIFDGYTHTKSQRFDLISRLIKKKMIKRTRINYSKHMYELLPKLSFKESSEMRIYRPISRRDRIGLIRYLTENK